MGYSSSTASTGCGTIASNYVGQHTYMAKQQQQQQPQKVMQGMAPGAQRLVG
jgi:hypothetical protein